MSGNFPQILIFGCGNMGGAMLRGWLAGGVPAERFMVVDPGVDDLPGGVTQYRAASDIQKQFSVVLLGIKPQMLASLASDIAALLTPSAIVISVLAGIRTETLSSHFPERRIVRLMPNLAVEIGKSPLALFEDQPDKAARAEIEALLGGLGTPVWLCEEAQMDAATALAGSGPAFVYRFIDALTQGGVAMGLPAETAEKLAMAMAEGAALLAARSNESPAELAARVTSAGGTTAAGLNVLDNEGALATLVEATLTAAQKRGAELAKG